MFEKPFLARRARLLKAVLKAALPVMLLATASLGAAAAAPREQIPQESPVDSAIGPLGSAAPPVVVPAPPIQGAFHDASGVVHPWSITAAHSIVWDGRPWVPVGVTFVPAAFNGSGAANSEAARELLKPDLARLDALRAAGVHDILLTIPRAEEEASNGASAPAGKDTSGGTAATPGPGADLPPTATRPVRFTDVPLPLLQSLLDALDQRGFQYGIDLHGRLRGGVPGYAFGEPFLPAQRVGPGTFMAAAPAGAGLALFVARDQAGAVVRMGSISADHGAFVVSANAAASVYFVMQQSAEDAVRSSGLWDGFADVRDSILFGLRALKPGRGLRFFLDPIDAPVALAGRAEYVFPASQAFQADYGVWLHRRYPDVQSLQRQWGAAPGGISDFATAARLVPDTAGSPRAAWDPVRDRTVTIAGGTAFWADFERFRSETARHDMDILASSLRRNIADVPVCYRWQRFSAIYAAPDSPVTYDGLAFSPQMATPRADGKAAYACAQIADVPVSRWFLVAGGTPALTMDDLHSFVTLGAKGYFLTPADAGDLPAATGLLIRYLRDTTVNAPAGSPAANAPGASMLTARPRDGVGREVRFAPESSVSAMEPTSYAAFWPNIIWFPWSLQIASARRFRDGTWWLPSLRPGVEIPVGANMEAYRMGSTGPVVLWSATGLRQERFHLPDAARVSWPPGVEMSHASHGLRTLTLSDEPVVMDGVELKDVFPEDNIDRVFAQTAQLKQSILLSKENRQRLEIDEATARRMKEKGQVYDAYLLLSFDLGMQRRLVLPYWWLEGEAASPQSFSGVAHSAQCSGGAYLWLNNPDPPPSDKPYSAAWTFSVMVPGAYEMWFGGTPPGQDWSSPVAWTLDGVPVPTQDRGPAGVSYPPIFHWARLADVTLTTGKHTLVATVTGP
ncbi:MAG: hypothetical protein LC772_07155, partial [Chloroflexi bacterium]|nr:hypothetical protein [Chloroflexota bacterium]